MFTGIVEETGRVEAAEARGELLVVRIRGDRTTRDLEPGGSIAVSGCCLTAIEVQDGSFVCELTPETLLRTAFDERLRPGRLVNLERPLRADGRFDGHIVQGHVDGVGRIRALEKDRLGDSAVLTIGFPASLARYLVPKGSVAVDGISLTVAALDADEFQIALIPYTLDVTHLKEAGAGDAVNLEVDVIAKYVERLVGPYTAGGGAR